MTKYGLVKGEEWGLENKMQTASVLEALEKGIG